MATLNNEFVNVAEFEIVVIGFWTECRKITILPTGSYRSSQDQVVAAEYKLALPAEADLVAELEEVQRQFTRSHTTPAKLPPPNATKKTAAKKTAKKTRKSC